MKRIFQQGPFLSTDTPNYSKTFDFVGTSRKNKGHTYRTYADTLEDAIRDICFSFRLSEKDFRLIQSF